MDKFITYLPWIASYTPFISFIAGILSEDVLLALAILAGHGLISLWSVVVFGFLGVLMHDTVFYFLARSSIASKLMKKLKLSPKHKKLVSFIERMQRNGYFISLLLSKFVYGTRVALIIFVGHRENSFLRYTIYNTVAVVAWFIIMLPLGWFAGQGLSQFLHIAKGIEKFLALFIFLILAIYLFNKLVVDALLKRKRKRLKQS